MGDVADRIHGHPHAIPGPPECSVAFGAPCPAGLALVFFDVDKTGFVILDSQPDWIWLGLHVLVATNMTDLDPMYSVFVSRPRLYRVPECFLWPAAPPCRARLVLVINVQKQI